MQRALFVMALLAPLLLPARAAAACVAPVPVYPGARQVGGPVSAPLGLGVTSEGRTGWATPDTLLDVQMFFYIRLTGGGWQTVAQLPGQYPDQFASSDRGPITTTLPVLEFSRDGNAERVRIVTEAGGYSVWLECNG
jgi:hypothetical protein